MDKSLGTNLSCGAITHKQEEQYIRNKNTSSSILRILKHVFFKYLTYKLLQCIFEKNRSSDTGSFYHPL